jgi:hypothetical protein
MPPTSGGWTRDEPAGTSRVTLLRRIFLYLDCMSVPAGPVWKMRTHVNRAFSRDGRKVYFNKPVDGMPQVHRVDISAFIRAHD